MALATSKPRIKTLPSSVIRDAGASISQINSSDEADSSSSADRNNIVITVALPAASSVAIKGSEGAKYDELANELGETKRRLDEMREQFDDERDTTTDLLEYHENVTRQLKETNQKLGKTIKELNAEKKVNKDLLSRVERSERAQEALTARLEKLERAQRAEGAEFSAVEHHQGQPQAARGHQRSQHPHDEDYEVDAPGGRHAKRPPRAEETLCRYDDEEGPGGASRDGGGPRTHGSTVRAQDPPQPITSSAALRQQELKELTQRLRAVIDAAARAGGGPPPPSQPPAQAAAEIERDRRMSTAERIAEAKDISRRLQVIIATCEAAMQDPQLPPTPDGRDT